MTNLFSSFSSWAYLIISLIGDNLQYLSFRFFEQLQYLVPDRGILSYVSILITIHIGFIAIFCAISTYFLAISIAISTFKPTLLLRKHSSCLLQAIFLIVRVVSGFIHAFIE
jgi:hypothetical protein